MKKVPHRIFLDESAIPKQWYNITADMPEKCDPLLISGTLKPAKASDLYPVFASELADQEFSEERFIDIPDEVRELYKMYRPAPLHRAYRLEQELKTPARIYYKYEGLNTSGSHKLNSALAQAYYNKKQGILKLATETGAGQWGTALAIACSYFGIDLRVYMVKASYIEKPSRRAVIEMFGANIFQSPSNTTEYGRRVLAADPNCPGSLGMAIGEAVEKVLETPGTRYVLGSVLNQVLLHQSIIGLEAKAQLESVDEYPDIVIGCSGGGSNLGGLMAAFMRDKLTGKAKPYFIAVEPAGCPSFTKGKFVYDFCDAGKVTPLAKMYTLGNGFMPSLLHAGGLRYHGMSPVLSKLYHDRHIDEARSEVQTKVFEAAKIFAKCEGILPAPESAHAIKATIDEAIKCRESGQSKTILFGLSGHGNFDLASYSNYNEGKMIDYKPSEEALAKGFASIPDIKL